MSWSAIVASVITKAASWVAARLIEWFNKRSKTTAMEKDIDNKLALLKAAYVESFDGKPVTPEQREKLKHAIRNFISNDSNGGM